MEDKVDLRLWKLATEAENSHFWQPSIKRSYKISKNLPRMFIWMQTSIHSFKHFFQKQVSRWSTLYLHNDDFANGILKINQRPCATLPHRQNLNATKLLSIFVLMKSGYVGIVKWRVKYNDNNSSRQSDFFPISISTSQFLLKSIQIAISKQ